MENLKNFVKFLGTKQSLTVGGKHYASLPGPRVKGKRVVPLFATGKPFLLYYLPATQTFRA